MQCECPLQFSLLTMKLWALCLQREVGSRVRLPRATCRRLQPLSWVTTLSLATMEETLFRMETPAEGVSDGGVYVWERRGCSKLKAKCREFGGMRSCMLTLFNSFNLIPCMIYCACGVCGSQNGKRKWENCHLDVDEHPFSCFLLSMLCDSVCLIPSPSSQPPNRLPVLGAPARLLMAT